MVTDKHTAAVIRILQAYGCTVHVRVFVSLAAISIIIINYLFSSHHY